MNRSIYLTIVFTLIALFASSQNHPDFQALTAPSNPNSTVTFPSRVRLNTGGWKIEWRISVDVPDSDNPRHIDHYDAYTYCDTSIIAIGVPGVAGITLHDVQVTLVHEIQHAMACFEGSSHNEYFNNMDVRKHPGIYWASPKWLFFIQNNPEVLQWLQITPKDKQSIKQQLTKDSLN